MVRSYMRGISRRKEEERELDRRKQRERERRWKERERRKDFVYLTGCVVDAAERKSIFDLVPARNSNGRLK